MAKKSKYAGMTDEERKEAKRKKSEENKRLHEERRKKLAAEGKLDTSYGVKYSTDQYSKTVNKTHSVRGTVRMFDIVGTEGSKYAAPTEKIINVYYNKGNLRKYENGKFNVDKEAIRKGEPEDLYFKEHTRWWKLEKGKSAADTSAEPSQQRAGKKKKKNHRKKK